MHSNKVLDEVLWICISRNKKIPFLKKLMNHALLLLLEEESSVDVGRWLSSVDKQQYHKSEEIL